MTPAQRAYESAPSNARALKALAAELSRIAGDRVDAEGVGSWRAPGDHRGQRADEVIVARSRAVLDRAVAEMVRRGYAVLGVREDDGEAWAWLAGGPAGVAAPADAPPPPVRLAKAIGALTSARAVPMTEAARIAVGVLLALRAAVSASPVRPPIRPRVERGPPGFRSSTITLQSVAGRGDGSG